MEKGEFEVRRTNLVARRMFKGAVVSHGTHELDSLAPWTLWVLICEHKVVKSKVCVRLDPILWLSDAFSKAVPYV